MATATTRMMSSEWARKTGDSKLFVKAVENFLRRWGYNETDGRVYAYLLLSGKPLTIGELSEELGISRSAVSVSLRRLLENYLVTYQKKGRTKYFSAVPAFLEKFLQQPKEMLEREVLPLEETLKKMIEESGDPEERAHLEGILKDVLTLDCVLRRLIKIGFETECNSNDGS